MEPRITTKGFIRDYIRETRLFKGRVGAAAAVILVLLMAVVSRLVYLDVFSHERYTTLSQNNRISIVAIPPSRGLIYDRNGVLLAKNVPSYSLDIVPEQVEHLEATIASLRKIIEIKDSDIERFRKLIRQKRYTKGVPLRSNLSEKEVASFAVNRPRFPGVDVAAKLVRHYPLGPLAVHAIGYVGRINEKELASLDPSNYRGTSHIGKIGVEKAYEDVLHGTVGVEEVEVNAQGRRLRVLKRTPPKAGRNVYLSIDIGLQALAEAALGNHRGAIVALEPDTGAVLALVSMPGYDPNPFVNGIESKDYSALRDSNDQPLYNRALRGVYPPGSTVKPFIGLGGLELGQISLSEKHYCPGWFRLEGHTHRYRDWKSHGSVALHTAIEQSCDTYFYRLATVLGIDRLHGFMSNFGFGKETGIDLGGEASGLMPSREWKQRARNEVWFPGETVITGTGQGYTLASPLQLASATAMLANHGRRMQPRVVAYIEEPATGKKIAQQATPMNTLAMQNPAHWQSIIDAMVGVVHGARGTARAIGSNAPYTMAGKTGTAQVFTVAQNEEYIEAEVDLRMRDHGLFIAFAPADQPRIAVAVVVENGGSGSAAAAPLARQVLDQYLSGQPGIGASNEEPLRP